MSEKIQAIRGMNDVLPDETHLWQYLEYTFSTCLNRYGYQEIRFPIVESTQLFKRTIGEVTDIVEKEMYTFIDLNGDSLTLRPEGTAGCVRACLEHGLLHNQQQKLWYYGPMFRHEKPQKGRYRQFVQLGVEALGIGGVDIELELILICKRFWTQLGIQNAVTLEINSLGELEERQRYRDKLVAYFKAHYDQLDEDSKRRLERNPLRILDSKNSTMQNLIAKAPKLIDELGPESKQHFDSFCTGLNSLGIEFAINPTLVRGLDYYGHTVFEWVTDKLGSQATVCAGGRYDKLIELIGGKPTPGIGFAIGVERLVLLQKILSVELVERETPLAFFIADGRKAIERALALAENLRNDAPTAQVIVNTSGGSFKSQFKKADKSGARFALILGEEELSNNAIGVKDLRQEGEQKVILQDDLIQYIQ